MADIVSSDVRSKMMSGIRGKNTKPELIIRSGLHRKGFRYSLHRRDLPGKPDLVFRRHNAVIFIHGCFWHKHNCHLFKMPSSRQNFWKEKLEKNVTVDTMSIQALQRIGWRIAIIWECTIKGKTRRNQNEVIRDCVKWLLSKKKYLELKGSE